MPAQASGNGHGLLPSAETLQRVRELALSIGMDAAIVESALKHWVEAYDFDLSAKKSNVDE